MLSTRYSIVIANRRTGVVRRMTLSARSVVALASVVCLVPALLVIGGARKAAWQKATLASQLVAVQQ